MTTSKRVPAEDVVLAPLHRNRDFSLLWSGMAVSVVGTQISATAYPLLVLALHYSAADAGLVGFMATLPYAVLQLPAGAFIDRWNRKRTMIGCDIGRAVALASVVAAVVLHRVSLAQLMVAAFVEGSLFVFFNIAEPTAVRAVVPRPQLPTALAQNQARNQGAALAGRPAAGLLFSVARFAPFLADALSYLASIAALLLIRTEFQDERTHMPLRRIPPEISEGIRWLWRQPFLRITALLVAGSNFMFQALVLVLIVIARDHGASSGIIGVMLAGSGIGGIAGAVIAPWAQRRLPANVIVIAATWTWAVLLVPVAFVTQPYLLGTLFAVMAFFGPPWNVVIATYRLTITPDQLLGRVSSVATVIAYGAIPVGSLIGGALLTATGARTTTLTLCAVVVGCAIAASLSGSVRSISRTS